jgi:acyl-CoA reductase-like NAD-dependent aldehyde dehydrogenase
MSDYNLLIDGKMVPGDQTMPVLNPATEEVLAQCPRASKSQLDTAVAAAKAAFPAWAATPIAERRKLVTRMAEVIEANTGELARLLTSEQGKPLADATVEVMGMAGFFRYLSSLDLPMKVIEDSGDRRVEAHRRPLGVIGAIIPWNYPLLILAFKLPSALLAGNTLVVKPAPTTPLATLKFAELVKDILPKGVLNVITDANDLGDVMTKHPDIRKISFTG